MAIRLLLLVLLVVLFSNQAFTQDNTQANTANGQVITQVTPQTVIYRQSTVYMVGSSYSFSDSQDKFWLNFSQNVSRTGWIGPSVSISSLMFLVMSHPDNAKPDNPYKYSVHDSTTGGVGFFGNFGIIMGQASLITSAGLELSITEEQRRNRNGYRWYDTSEVTVRPVGQIGFRLPFVYQTNLDLGYKTTGTAFVSIMAPIR